MIVRPVGADALLAEVDGFEHALALADHVRSSDLAVAEVVPGACTVLFDGVADAVALRSLVESWRPSIARVEGPVVEVPVTYDGADLDDVAARWGCTPDEVVARHTSYDFVSAFCGFAPGFAYLAGLPSSLAVPRLATPRTRVPAGSVALADTWCGVYPTASPGGWRLLGRTEVTLWDPDSDPDSDGPALLAPGTRVRFVAT